MCSVRGVLLAWLAAVAAACGAQPATTPQLRSNLLLVTIDTLRADRIGTGVAPVMDGLAAKGLRFVNARTVAPLTLPAHVSIMTGQLPPAHGVRLNGVAANPGARALAVRLKRLGYRTAAVVGAFVLDRRFGLAGGFDTYDDEIRRDPAAADRLEAERPANVVIDRAVEALSAMSSAQPWFLWVHLYDPHAPYAAEGHAADVESAYDAEVRFVDRELARLLRTIDQRAGAQTAVVITGDHGEGLGEHGETTHGMLLFDSTLKVPLIVVAPGVAPAVRSEPVSLIDIAPTLLALAGEAPDDESLTGRSLLRPPGVEREIYAETDYPAAAGWHPARALVQDHDKFIASGGARLFDLSTDASEQHNLATARSQLAGTMAARLDTIGRALSSGRDAAPVADRATAARLRSLGYLAANPEPVLSDSVDDAADHTHAWAAFERALSVRARGDAKEAASLLAVLSRSQTDAPIFESTYAQVLAEAGRPVEALRVLQALVRRRPDDPTLYHELAVVARTAGQRDEALRAETAALAIDSTLPAAHHGLGLLRADAGDHRGAATAFEEAARLDPTNGPYLSDLGNARRALGDLERARQAYQLALERDRSLADAANGLGVILVQQRRAKEAVTWLERAVEGDAAFVEAHLNLAIALQESGQHDLALARYRHVERIAPAGAPERAAARALRQQLERR